MKHDASNLETCNIPGTTETVLALLGVADERRVLDIGCYRGDVSRELLRRGFAVSSCDLMPYPGTEQLPAFRQVDASSALPYADRSFDAIVCTEVIEHLENPTNLLRECARLLTDGGTLVLSTPNVSSSISRIVYGVTGEFPQFHEEHFKEWGHISPVGVSWIQRTAQKFGLELQQVTSEGSVLGWKRKLLFWVSFPFFAAIARPQQGSLTADHTLIVVLKRQSY